MCLFFFFLFLSTQSQNRTTLLHGNTTLGYYYLKVKVGSPPQIKTLIFDTGSQLTIFPCKGCLRCGTHTTPPFNFDNSSTFEFLNHSKPYSNWVCPDFTKYRCQFQQRYLEGSEYMGYYATDKFLIEDSTAAINDTHIFGCALTESNDFFSQTVDGIIGFGMNKGSVQNPPNFADQLFLSNTISTNTFAILLGENKGQFRLGGWNQEYHLPHHHKSLIDCSHLDWSVNYQLDFTGLRVGSTWLNYDFRKIRDQDVLPVIDTGTTYIYLARPLYNQFINVFTDFCLQNKTHCSGKRDFQECFYFSPDKYSVLQNFLDAFPNITFVFNKRVEYTLQSKDYLMLNSEYETFYCVGIKPLDKNVFGAIFLRNSDFFFDRNKQTIEYVRSNFTFFEYQVEESVQDEIKLVSKIKKSFHLMIRAIQSQFVYDFLKTSFKMTVLLIFCLCIYFMVFVFWFFKKAKAKNEKKF